MSLSRESDEEILKQRKKTPLSTIYEKDKDIITRVPSKDLISDSLIGLEIEAISIPSKLWDSNNLKWWKLVTDGSVRGGGEFVLRQPLSGVDLITALDEIDKVVKENKAIHFDYQTSLHVHLDSRDITAQQFQNLISIYTLFEPLLFSVCGEDREDNIFCLSMSNAPTNLIDVLKSMDYLFDLGDIYFLNRKTQRSPRYSALNFSALNRFGSLEFRGHRGTADKKEILKWVNILLCIKEYSIHNEDIEALLSSISLDGFEVCTSSLFKGLLTYNSFYEDKLWENLRLVHQLINYGLIKKNTDLIFKSITASRYFKGLGYKYLKNKSKNNKVNSDKREVLKYAYNRHVEDGEQKREKKKVKKETYDSSTRGFVWSGNITSNNIPESPDYPPQHPQETQIEEVLRERDRAELSSLHRAQLERARESLRASNLNYRHYTLSSTINATPTEEGED